MFTRITLISVILIALSVAFLSFKQTLITPDDLAQYHEMILESKEMRSKRALERRPGVQLREKVEKIFWTVEKGVKLPIHIYADRSELTFLQKKRSFEIQEKLFGIVANMSQMRNFVAEEGLYLYPEQKFVAFHATLDIGLEGQISSPKIEIDSLNRIICFKPKGVFQKIDFEADQLLFYPSQEMIELSGNVQLERKDEMKATGNVAYLSQTTTTLEGNVCLYALDGVAIANTLTYNPKTRKTHLCAHAQEKVLFCKDGMRLCAPEIAIDPITETVKGSGEVRFSFTLEEENEMDKLLKRLASS